MPKAHAISLKAVADPASSSSESAAINSSAAADIKSWVREILDWVVKLLPVIATIAVTMLADQYKTSLTASTLLSEREKADSQLRSEMFSKLVDPISGSKSGADVPLEREQLLAELLSLNFHEHIGMKPLLNHVDARLAQESLDGDESKAARARLARQSFRSVARTVISRQTAMLTRSSTDAHTDDNARIQKLDLGTLVDDPELLKHIQADGASVERFAQPVEVMSPSGHHKLYLQVDQQNWTSETFHVAVSIYSVKDGKEIPLADHDFELSWFDFPLTDNTLLGDGTRFAIVLDQVYDMTGRFSDKTVAQMATEATRRAKINIIWFPKDYIAARERPTNYREFRRSLGLDN